MFGMQWTLFIYILIPSSTVLLHLKSFFSMPLSFLSLLIFVILPSSATSLSNGQLYCSPLSYASTSASKSTYVHKIKHIYHDSHFVSSMLGPSARRISTLSSQNSVFYTPAEHNAIVEIINRVWDQNIAMLIDSLASAISVCH